LTKVPLIKAGKTTPLIGNKIVIKDIEILERLKLLTITCFMRTSDDNTFQSVKYELNQFLTIGEDVAP
jgi:hypothetical protein